eukprot:TRINITY_DN20336_c0_g6_i2.p2 TRINITY_DN20336_c0_g6~~TRINITY_DN20336_c0_g6_i2.p2  ORF type:complete len:122 (+),score=43.09 TRINITY_DN20336_c0_g6_i2:409-774(+)
MREQHNSNNNNNNSIVLLLIAIIPTKGTPQAPLVEVVEAHNSNNSAQDVVVVDSRLQKSLQKHHRQKTLCVKSKPEPTDNIPVSYTHLRAHETPEHLVCRLLLEKKKKKKKDRSSTSENNK